MKRTTLKKIKKKLEIARTREGKQRIKNRRRDRLQRASRRRNR